MQGFPRNCRGNAILPFEPLPAQEQTAAAIELGSPFPDNAILQREKDVPVWGWSKPVTSIKVEFAGQKTKAKDEVPIRDLRTDTFSAISIHTR